MNRFPTRRPLVALLRHTPCCLPTTGASPSPSRSASTRNCSGSRRMQRSALALFRTACHARTARATPWCAAQCCCLLRLIPWCTQHFDRTVTAHRLLVPRAAPPRVHSYAVVRWPGRSDDGRLPPATLRYILRRVPSRNERRSNWRDLGGRERTLIIDQATRLLELFARETE